MTSLVSPSQAGPITTNIAYDGPLPTSLGWSGPVAGQVSWTYNDRFLIETETVGALPETAVTYQYDNDGLVTKAGDLTIARDPASGRVTSKTIGNIRERFQYNEFAELSRQTVERMSGTTVVETLYDVIYDDSGVNGARDARLGSTMTLASREEWRKTALVPTVCALLTPQLALSFGAQLSSSWALMLRTEVGTDILFTQAAAFLVGEWTPHPNWSFTLGAGLDGAFGIEASQFQPYGGIGAPIMVHYDFVRKGPQGADAGPGVWRLGLSVVPGGDPANGLEMLRGALTLGYAYR